MALITPGAQAVLTTPKPAAPLSWWRPSLSGAIEFDVNSLSQVSSSVTLTGDLFTWSLDGGTGYTDPADGAGFAVPLRDMLDRVLSGPPMMVSMVLTVTSPPSAASGVVLQCGIMDGDAIATDNTIGIAIDYDGASQRGRACDTGGGFTASATSANIVSVAGNVASYGNPTEIHTRLTKLDIGTYNSSGSRLTAATHNVNEEFVESDPHFYASAFFSGAGTAQTITARLGVIAVQVPTGGWLL
jgi:hypothetical protein